MTDDDLTQLRSRVMDEADRIIKQDSFPHVLSLSLARHWGQAVGTSISPDGAPAEEQKHPKICKLIQGTGSRALDHVNLDGLY